MKSSQRLREGSAFGKPYKGEVPSQPRKHFLTIVNKNLLGGGSMDIIKAGAAKSNYSSDWFRQFRRWSA